MNPGGRMNDSRTANKLRAQMIKFSGVISSGLPKVAQRFVQEMLYGIQAGQTVVLSEIGRCLEEPVSLKKVEERLSRQLMRRGLGEIVQHNVLTQGAVRIKEDTLIIVDPTDIQKKYAQKMPYLGDVYDGSTREIGPGYMVCQVVAAELEGNKVVPLWSSLYSSLAPGFISENEELLRAMRSINQASGGRGVYVIDRDGDRDNLFLPMIDEKMRFLIRLRGDRHLLCGGEKKSALELADECRCPYTEVIARTKAGKQSVHEITFGYRKVRLPERDRQLYLLVVKGFGKKPLMVLTTEPLRKNRKVLFRMLRSYIRRWSIEETIRFVKQCYGLENVRVLTYQSLQNLMPLVLAATYFAATILDTHLRLQVLASTFLQEAKRIFGIPDFRLYALSDGLRRLFSRNPGKLIPVTVLEDGQLYFENFAP
jgi:hypothetical protein